MTSADQNERTRVLERIFGPELAARYRDPYVTSATWLAEARAALGLNDPDVAEELAIARDIMREDSELLRLLAGR